MFLDCPSGQSIYLDPNLDEASVTWTVPRIPGFFSSLSVRNNTRPPPLLLGVGVHEIRYTAGPLDVGADLVCSFDMRVRHGFSLLVQSLAHVTAGGMVHDFFLADGNLVSDGGARPRAFDGNVLARPLAIGLLSLDDEPFTLFATGGAESRFIVQMQWCEAGYSVASDATFANGTTTVTLLRPSDSDAAAALTFADRGSGVTADGRCFRIAAESSLLTGTLSFLGIDIAFEYTGAVRDRRDGGGGVDIVSYRPRSPNFVVMESRRSDGAPFAEGEDGPRVTQEDSIAPRWLNCTESM